jgi:p21-activated kinase 2
VAKENPKILLDIVINFEHKTEHKNKLLTREEFHTRLKEVRIEESDPSKKYQFDGILGKGAMCKVYKCTLRENKDRILACRIMKMSTDPHLFEKVKT